METLSVSLRAELGSPGGFVGGDRPNPRTPAKQIQKKIAVFLSDAKEGQFVAESARFSKGMRPF